MMKTYASIFLVIFAVWSVSAQQTALIKLDIQIDQESASPQQLFLRGNHILLGSWATHSVRLQKRSKRQWGGILLFNVGDNIQFVLEDEKGQNTSDTISLDITQDTTLQLIYKTSSSLEDQPAQGTLHRLPSTVEEQLIQRLVTVRTPVGYEEDTSRTYPVVFFQDGQFVFGNGAGNKNHWMLTKTLDSLEHVGAIEPFITVAVDHEWSNRSMEYADTDLGERYAHYMCKTLPAKIDLLFRTKSGSENRYLAGAVAGGFINTLAVHKYPGSFQNLILLSPAFLIHENDIFAALDKDSIWRNDLHVYMDIGEFGMDEDLKVGCDSMNAVWSDRGVPVHYEAVLNSIPDGENFRWRIKKGLMHFFGKEKS